MHVRNTLGCGDGGQFVHVRRFPSFHDRLPLDLQMVICEVVVRRRLLPVLFVVLPLLKYRIAFFGTHVSLCTLCFESLERGTASDQEGNETRLFVAADELARGQ